MDVDMGKVASALHESASLIAAIAALFVSIRSGKIAKQAAESAANAHQAAREAVKEQINFALRDTARVSSRPQGDAAGVSSRPQGDAVGVSSRPQGDAVGVSSQP